MPAYQHFLPGPGFAGRKWLGLLPDLYQPFLSDRQGNFDEKSATIRVIVEADAAPVGAANFTDDGQTETAAFRITVAEDAVEALKNLFAFAGRNAGAVVYDTQQNRIAFFDCIGFCHFLRKYCFSFFWISNRLLFLCMQPRKKVMS